MEKGDRRGTVGQGRIREGRRRRGIGGRRLEKRIQGKEGQGTGLRKRGIGGG